MRGGRKCAGGRGKWEREGAGKIGEWRTPGFKPGEEIATRMAGKQVMQAFKDAVPTMIGGAADLVESTYTEFEGGGRIDRQKREIGWIESLTGLRPPRPAK